MLSKEIKNQIRLANWADKKLSGFNGTFRSKETKVSGQDLTTLEKYGFIECVSRETEKVVLPFKKTTYVIVNTRNGRKFTHVDQLSEYAKYTLEKEEEDMVVNSKYKVYRVAMTFDTFMSHLKDTFYMEFVEYQIRVRGRQF